ncbi:hypothetical protein L249_7593 [Ophiocordyceps polyrhachis-furcata BCC 54312]|uniref:alpha-1,2-Mannosidase n=1 Tax=Ophiocordyceps polyrhachis-furcata BCC 54312 TaxID=1330021 RepID=A0A367LA59_9HYPO|nr:hypothetical protein L249_7593 [Ophiocordyceps polyrhachis-furcata BCC 54312]
MPRRRYRLFSVCAAVIIFLLYRLSTSSWQQPQPGIVTAPDRRPDSDNVHLVPPPALVSDSRLGGLATKEEPAPGRGGADSDNHANKEPDGGPHRSPTLKHELDGDGARAKTRPRPPKANAPDAAAPRDPVTGDETPMLTWQNPPNKHSTSDVGKQSDEDAVHWIRPKQHYPVPKESIITLPTRAAVELPKIQFDFPPESPDAKATRLKRLKRVKTELERSWSGYKKHAWLHDELSPVSGGYRDPFCGWSATLIDSLDTLWIAGMKDEFGKAVEAVETIDFTRSARADIPVFETTIRYLGGLIAAYDVSGAAYPVLLDKAVELAEILMGIFDTPNRMPVLYYQWRPEYASQPHLAGRVGMAELGTLSLEFTRLAQLTAQHKYYDAVDRITNALVDLQTDGTLIPGLFPENLDASGCNRTAARLQDSMSFLAKQQVESQSLVGEPNGFGGHNSAPGDVNGGNEKRSDSSSSSSSTDKAIAFGSAFRSRATGREGPYKADGIKADWDCVAQGLVPGGIGPQKFHMGGGQDSAYEYFGKEYQLLRGREPKYRKLYQETAIAVAKLLLFRPMVEGPWDILFPASVTVSPSAPEYLHYEYSMSHLACFIGGMYGLGGKLFSRPEDVEVAKKLTDGCVWAYQATASGIMPEHAHVVTCPDMEKCDFNKTRWWEEIDPARRRRDEEVRLWEKKHGSAGDGTSSRRQRPGRLDKRAAVDLSGGKEAAPTFEFSDKSKLPESLRLKLNKKYGQAAPKTKESDDQTKGTTPLDGSGSGSEDADDDVAKGRTVSNKPQKPLSHKEYVEMLLEETKLPPGFSSVDSASYILRPEAIESVWYMYRITGDPTWMEKGWRMFESTVRATRTSIANSAVDDVLLSEPNPKDEMESFWIAETLKYYYLLFSEPDVISLDDWVLNTEAHPFKLSR